MSQSIQLSSDLAPSSVDDIPALVEALVAPIRETVSRPAAIATGWTLASSPAAVDRLPRFDQSAVDGYAWAGSIPASGLRLLRLLRAGDPAVVLRHGEAVHVMTGASIPVGADRVAMQERCKLDGDIVTPPPTDAGANIRREGEDIAAGTPIAPEGTCLDARHAALLAATGTQTVSCVRPLRIRLIATGNELCDAAPGAAQIRDSNTPMMKALLSTGPDIDLTAEQCPDRPSDLRDLFVHARDTADLIITTGGMSFGQEDHVRSACLAAGGEFVLHTLLMKPGKPVGLARIRQCIHLGLPGNPFAALVAFLLVGRPVLDRLRGRQSGQRWLEARADFTLERQPGRVEFFPAKLAPSNPAAGLVLHRLGKGGSARLAPLVAADGLGRVDAHADHIKPGDPLRFMDFTNVLGN